MDICRENDTLCIQAKTEPLLGITAPVLYDLMNLANPDEIMINGYSVSGFKFNNADNINIDDWDNYNDEILRISVVKCRKNNWPKNCSILAMKHIQNTIINEQHNDKIIEFMADIILEPHINTNDSYGGHGLIPFCWFGGKFDWVGQDIPNGSNLKLCNLFKPAFPFKSNCFTTKSTLQELTGGEKLTLMGSDNGLFIVIDSYFVSCIAVF
jgi:hypothetical protein